MLKKYNSDYVFPDTDPFNIIYYITNLDLIQGGYIVCKISGDTSQFLKDCPNAQSIDVGQWDGMIVKKLIYSNIAGANGIERIQNYLDGTNPG